MHAESYAPESIVVRSEIADSVIRMLDDEAESFSDGKEPGERALSATFAGIAGYVRAGKSIYFELGFEPYGAPMSREIISAIEHTAERFMHAFGNGNRIESDDWRYLSDLAALAADIEGAFSPV